MSQQIDPPMLPTILPGSLIPDVELLLQDAGFDLAHLTVVTEVANTIPAERVIRVEYDPDNWLSVIMYVSVALPEWSAPASRGVQTQRTGWWLVAGGGLVLLALIW